MVIMDQPFFTLASNGMQTEGSSSCDENESSSVPTTPPSRTHDTSRTNYHMKDIAEFAARLDQAAQGVFPNRDRFSSRYKDVQVILMRWEDDNRLGVSCEFEDLAKVFAEDYGFKTTMWLIPTEDPLDEITTKVLALKKDAGQEDKLLIVYYGGHAMMNDARQQIWLRTGKQSQGVLEWFAIQPLFMNAKADVLFLLDCCAAASATATSNAALGIKETIAACGFEAIAPEPGAHSFTNELIEVLKEWRYNHLFSAAMLHSEILARLRHPKPKKDMFGKIVEARRTPVYVVTTNNANSVSIALARRTPKRASNFDDSPPLKRRRQSPGPEVVSQLEPEDTVQSAAPSLATNEEELPSLPSYPKGYQPESLNQVLFHGDLVVPHVLLSISLEGDELLDYGAWSRWTRECPALTKFMRIEGMFKSHSTLLLVSLPVAIWDLLPKDLACSFIGFVDSINYTKCSRWEENLSLQNWFRSYEATFGRRTNYPESSGKQNFRSRTSSMSCQLEKCSSLGSDLAITSSTGFGPAVTPGAQSPESYESPLILPFRSIPNDAADFNLNEGDVSRSASVAASWTSSCRPPSPPRSDGEENDPIQLSREPSSLYSLSPSGTPVYSSS